MCKLWNLANRVSLKLIRNAAEIASFVTYLCKMFCELLLIFQCYVFDLQVRTPLAVHRIPVGLISSFAFKLCERWLSTKTIFRTQCQQFFCDNASLNLGFLLFIQMFTNICVKAHYKPYLRNINKRNNKHFNQFTNSAFTNRPILIFIK